VRAGGTASRLFAILALLGLVAALWSPPAAGAQSFLVIAASTPEAPELTTPEAPNAEAEGEAWLDTLMATMSPADKVGQLFLVTFRGRDVGAGSDAARLIQELRVGGVILAPENENLVNEGSAAEQVLSLTSDLQGLAFNASQPITITSTVPVTFTAPASAEGQSVTPTPQVLSTVVTITQQITYSAQDIPLLVAISQEGDGYPSTALRAGFTDLPSAMALGATWKDENAQAVGRIVGRELAAAGVNLLLGPSLDVLVEPRQGLSDHLGTRVFGGDPFWTGEMGKAYIRGVHEGSEWHVATVAKHLPGLGGSDRSLEEEVATVDKSLQDLRLIDLPPFVAVTQAELITETTDALMTAHIRYRGFQGNIRYVTPPISLNAQAMELIMALEELAGWRGRGGVLVSDELGIPAIRRYFSPTLDSFPHRQIAVDAFQAGNDILNLSRFTLHDSWAEQMRNIEDTILFFQSRYAADDNFRSRVDQSVRRILQMKRRLYPVFSLEECTSDEAALGEIGVSGSTIAQVAKQAVTLLYPSTDELALRMPRPPRPDEDIVIFSDAREARECSTCSPFYLLDPNSLRDTMLRLYGPQATGQVTPERVAAFTFAELRSFLNSGKPDLNRSIGEAEWLVFSMLDYAPLEDPDSAALKQFLRERSSGPETQKLVVLAYEAPYYLDTTEISKLTAYYGTYSKIQPFIEASIRALFLEYTPTGKSPITVEGVGYDLTRQLSPNPDQVIQVLPAEEAVPAEGTPQPLSLQVGDSLDVRTSVVLDLNGNPVPDETPVTFSYVYQGEGLGGQKQAWTVNGIAATTITLEREGELQITATSDPATNSAPLVVRLSGGTTQILTPTPAPTSTPTPTVTPSPTPTPSPTLTPTTSPTVVLSPATIPLPPQPRLRWLDLLLSVLGMVLAGSAVYRVGLRLNRDADAWNPSLRLALWSGVCGLLGYLFYGLALPGSSILEPVPPGVRGLLIGLMCGLLPLAASFLVHRQGKQRR
jgi:beta-N-acetylhexosaminidase